MTAQTIMNPTPVVLHPSDTVGTASRYLLDHHLRHVPVVDEAGRYLGIFGIFSLLRRTLPQAATLEGGLENLSFVSDGLQELREHLQQVADESVLTCVRQDIPVVHSDTPLMETVLVLLRTRIALPVVEKGTGRLVGIISSWDALKTIVDEECF
jgi:CBS domain-containing protein